MLALDEMTALKGSELAATDAVTHAIGQSITVSYPRAEYAVQPSPELGVAWQSSGLCFASIFLPAWLLSHTFSLHGRIRFPQ